MDNGHVEETAEKSGLTGEDALRQASPTNLLTAAFQKLECEMDSTPCNQTETAKFHVKSALEVLDARTKNRVSAAKG